MTIDRLLTIPEAAALVGCSTEAIRQKIRRGVLSSVKGNDGRVRLRLTDADVEAMQAGRPYIRPSGQLSERPAERPSDQPSEQAAVIKALEDHVQTLREQAERERAERERLLDELAERDRRIEQARTEHRAEIETERQRGRDLADRLDQAQRDRLTDAEQHRAETAALREKLAAERGRPWWRRLRRR